MNMGRSIDSGAFDRKPFVPRIPTEEHDLSATEHRDAETAHERPREGRNPPQTVPGDVEDFPEQVFHEPAVSYELAFHQNARELLHRSGQLSNG